jgi:hypothetical protein
MAIDFMVMPVSRYLAGDFVTPAMAMSWKIGVPYRIVGPEGTREFPPEQPFGGPDAPARRRSLIQAVVDAMAPAFGGTLPWNEASEAVPRFERVDAGSFQALCEHAMNLARPEAPGSSAGCVAPPIQDRRIWSVRSSCPPSSASPSNPSRPCRAS